MGTVRPIAIVATSHPVEAYGGKQLSEEMIEEIAQAIGRGDLPLNFGHDTSRPVNISNVTSGTRRGPDGYLQAWAEFDVEEARWSEFETELRAADIEGFGAMSITFMEPLDGEEVVESPVKVAGDAHHFTDDEIRSAATILRSLDPSAAGQRLYQFSAVSDLRVVFDLTLNFVMGIGPSIAAAVIYDAAKRLFRGGKTNTFDIAFRESSRGVRSIKVAIKVDSDEELKIALERLPAVLESGARGIFVHNSEGYVRVDDDTPPAIETAEGTLELEEPEDTSSAEEPESPTTA